MDTPPIINGVKTWQLASWTEYYNLIAAQFSNSPAYIFRGHADATWQIKSTLDRLECKYPTHPNFWGHNPTDFNCSPASRAEHLLAFRQSMRGRVGVMAAPVDDDECWALAQHHGLATPMLDWTLSPFVALFFAFEQPTTIDNRVVLAVSTSVIKEKHTEADPAPLPFIPYNEASYRLLAQAGLFLKMPKNTELEAYVKSHFVDESSSSNNHAREVLIKIQIKNSEQDRKDCLKMLNKMNINRMSLFPDPDGAAAYINALWEIDFDTSLGYISAPYRTCPYIKKVIQPYKEDDEGKA
jgi:hypothetical protein